MKERVQEVLKELDDKSVEAELIKDLWAKNERMRIYLEFLEDIIERALSKRWN